MLKDVAQGRYAYALMLMLFALAAVLAVLSWLWNPHDGYAGFGQLLSRYLVSVGLPFERWIEHLAQLADRESDAHVFVEEALGAMVSLRWVSGAQWSAAGVTADKGTPTAYRASWDIRGQRFDVHVRSRLTPGLAMHLKLLAEVLAYFYEAKRREEAERVNAYERAIHETGARLTHDVKNLLQHCGRCAPPQGNRVRMTKRRCCAHAAAAAAAHRSRERHPREAASATIASVVQTSAVAWWEGLKLRYEGRGVEFECAGIDPQLQVPGELFDRVAENLIDNALRKAQVRPRCRSHSAGWATPRSPYPTTVCRCRRTSRGACCGSEYRPPGLGVGCINARRRRHSSAIVCRSRPIERRSEVCAGARVSQGSLPALTCGCRARISAPTIRCRRTPRRCSPGAGGATDEVQRAVGILELVRIERRRIDVPVKAFIAPRPFFPCESMTARAPFPPPM